MSSWWVGALIQAAPYVYSAVTSSSTYSEQSDTDAEYASLNALAISSAGEVNAEAITAIGEANATATILAAETSNVGTQAIADYNSDQAMFLADYNATLLEQEALIVLEEADLELSQLKTQQQYDMGAVKVAHGASGAIMDQDTSAAVTEALAWEQELDEFIVRRGADVEYANLMDEAAMSRWSGLEEATQIQLESALIQSSTTANAVLSASTTITQAEIDAEVTEYNADVSADSTYQSGMLSSETNDYSSDSSFWSGLFSASTTLASSYLKSQATSEESSALTSLL